MPRDEFDPAENSCDIVCQKSTYSVLLSTCVNWVQNLRSTSVVKAMSIWPEWLVIVHLSLAWLPITYYIVMKGRGIGLGYGVRSLVSGLRVYGLPISEYRRQ